MRYKRTNSKNTAPRRKKMHIYSIFCQQTERLNPSSDPLTRSVRSSSNDTSTFSNAGQRYEYFTFFHYIALVMYNI